MQKLFLFINLFGFLNASLVNYQDKDGDMPIHKAIKNNMINQVKVLIESGSFLDTREKLGNTPLMLAVTFLNIDMVLLLLDNWTDLTTMNDAGETPITLLGSKRFETLRAFWMHWHNQEIFNKIKQINIMLDEETPKRIYFLNSLHDKLNLPKELSNLVCQYLDPETARMIEFRQRNKRKIFYL